MGELVSWLRDDVHCRPAFSGLFHYHQVPWRQQPPVSTDRAIRRAKESGTLVSVALHSLRRSGCRCIVVQLPRTNGTTNQVIYMYVSGTRCRNLVNPLGTIMMVLL